MCRLGNLILSACDFCFELWLTVRRFNTTQYVSLSLFFPLSLSHVHFFSAAGTAGGDLEGDQSAKRPMTEEEKLEQVKRSECTHH